MLIMLIIWSVCSVFLNYIDPPVDDLNNLLSPDPRDEEEIRILIEELEEFIKTGGTLEEFKKIVEARDLSHPSDDE